MNYSRLYNELVNSARNREKPMVSERHHIVPRSMGGNNGTSNLVDLTPREHFVAHHLLWKIHRTSGMALAFKMMRHTRGMHISAREYERIQSVTKMHLSELGKMAHANGTGIHSLPAEIRSQYSKLSSGGKVVSALKLGMHGWSAEQRKAHSSQVARSRSRERQLADAENLRRINLAKTVEERIAISQSANNTLKNIVQEEWNTTLTSKRLPLNFQPTLQEAKIHGLKFYWGKICTRHPEQNGKRHVSSRACAIYHSK